MKRIIVTGSREFPSMAVVFKVLDGIRPDLVIHGGARGTDSFAHEWAFRNERDVHVFRAKWRRVYGIDKTAGHQRNQRMLEAYPGVDVVAFVYGKATGTRDCIRRAIERGHAVSVYDESGLLTTSGKVSTEA